MIDKMKRKSIFLLVGMLFMYLILFAVGSPSRLVVNGETVINNKGIPDVLLVLLALLIIVLDIVLAKKISSPLQKALDEECDPRKHFVLCRAFLRSKKKQLLQESVDYLYLGCYPSCLECTEKILTYSNTAFRLCGLFNKARVCFFRGDQETFTQALKQYEAEFNGKKHMRKRTRAILGNWLNNMDLLAAIMRNDVDAAGQYRTVTSWSGNSRRATSDAE